MNQFLKICQRTLAALVLICLASVPSYAQQAGEEPVVESAAQSSYLPARKQVYDIVIMGDVLGTGLWAGMNRFVETEDRVTVTGRIQESSGLARPKLYNWAKAADNLLGSRPFDIAAIMLGANDARDINGPEGFLRFGSDEWRKAYGEQINALVSSLKKHNVAIYWIGVPPMGRKSYDEAMKVVASVERQVMAERGVRYIDLRLLLADSDDKYTDRGDDGTGTIVRLRSRNGVKFIAGGNDRLAVELMKLVRADIAIGDGAGGGPAVVPLQEEVILSPEELAALPAFVAERPGAEAPVKIEPAQLPGLNYTEIARVNEDAIKRAAREGLTLFDKVRSSTIPGSAAQLLFMDGVWPDAPAERFDAFSVAKDPASTAQ
jgi:lysophospholipase L1-like esterase